MLRPKTALAVAELYEDHFEYVMNVGGERVLDTVVDTTGLRDFWLEREYPDEWLSWALALPRRHGSIKEAIIAKRSDQVALRRLTQDILNATSRPGRHISATAVEKVKRLIELDGYRFEAGRLRQVEEQAFQVEEVVGVLRALYRACGLPRYEQIDHDLKGSEDHYANGIWGDSIKRVRDAYEITLFEIARARTNAATVPDRMPPREVRRVLHECGFHTEVEHRFCGALYSLVSEQGGHPNMSEKENALLCRQHVLTAMHFALLHFTAVSQPTP